MAKKKQQAEVVFDKRKVITALNEALELELACQIRYDTHAAWVKGPSAEAIAARLKEIADDEREHAQKLRDRILALGGVPIMMPRQQDLIEARDIKRIININMAEEKSAIAIYQNILGMVPHKEALLFETVEHVLKDEQEHFEELQRLIG